MQVIVSFISGLAIGLVLFFESSSELKTTTTTYQERLDNCSQKLAIIEAEKNGMLLNK